MGVHSVSIVAAGWRDRTVARIGEQTWQGLYALVGIAGFALIVWGYGLARQEPVVIYVPPVGVLYGVFVVWLHRWLIGMPPIG